MGAYCQTEVRQYRAIQGYGVLRAFGAAHQLSAALTVPCAVEKTLVHLFYLGNIEKEKQRLYKKALKQAKKTYEDDIELCNLTFNSKFSLSSLYLNGLGFVEDFSLSAYVVSKSKRQNKRKVKISD